MAPRAFAAEGERIFTVRELKSIATNSTRLFAPVRMEGAVLWSSPKHDRMFLQQDDDVALVETDLSKFDLRFADKVTVEGRALVRDHASRFTFMDLPIVDNDGIHGTTERSGSVYLTKGGQAIELAYFNRLGEFGLAVAMEGPAAKRQAVSAEMLRHLAPTGAGAWQPGVAFQSFEGSWNRLPNFSALKPSRSGSIPTFDLSARSRIENVAVRFWGQIEVPQEGFYRFYTSSDDGSRLHVGQSSVRVEVIGKAQPPVARRIGIARSLTEDETSFWATVSGEVAYAGLGVDGWEFELRSANGRMRVQLPTIPAATAQLLLKGRIRATGIAQTVRTADGGRVAGELLVPDLGHISLLNGSPELWNSAPLVKISELKPAAESSEFVRIRGTVQELAPGKGLVVQEGAERILVETVLRLPEKVGGAVEVLGRPALAQGGKVLQWGVFRALGQEAGGAVLPILTTIGQIRTLKKEEASKSYPVLVQGVITWAKPGDVDGVVQDGTGGIFVGDLAPSPTDTPRIGDFVEIRGVSEGADFSPRVGASAVRVVDRGRIPEPARPDLDQLTTGSLDCELVELRGAVTAIQENVLTLVVPGGGSMRLEVEQIDPVDLSKYRDAQVRIRGVLKTEWESETFRAHAGQVGIRLHSIQMDAAAPADPFDLPVRTIAELVQFDPLTASTRRVKVAGQITHRSGSEFRMADGALGARFLPKDGSALNVGDRVEVVGFPKFGGASPVLIEADARKTGMAPLPDPVPLSQSHAANSRLDSTLAQLDCVMIDQRMEGVEEILEVRFGARILKARLKAAISNLPKMAPGSQLRVTGVYSSDRAHSDGEAKPEEFEILLNSSADVQVLKAPPWWTSERSLFVLTALGVVLAGALVWVRMLRRRVLASTRQLRQEVEDRKQAEAAARQASQEAQAANVAKGQFLANMSHEIRTPMNGVIGMTGMLLQTPLDAEQRDYAETVRVSSEALLTVINDILDFSKVEAGKLDLEVAPFDLRDLVESAVGVVAPNGHAKGLELACIVEAGLPEFLLGDAGRIRQVILNLAGNAVKFTHAGEVVVRVTGREEAGAARIRVEIRDSGIGIETEALPKLFQPFAQADASMTRRFGGTGLGLAICDRLVKAMRGEMGVESVAGKGSTFWFTLTLPVDSSPREAALELPENVRNARALIVHESAAVRQGLREQLLRLGVRAQAEADSVEAALDLVRAAIAEGNPLKIAFVGKNQNAFAPKVREIAGTGELKLVGVSAPGDAENGAKKIFDDAISAPIRIGRLQRLLEELFKPTAASAPAGNALAPVAADWKAPGPLRILLAEDNPVNQKVALRQLQKLGYSAFTAMDGVEVLEQLKQFRFDLILMDCAMPRLDGYETSRRIRESAEGASIRIVAMTANAMQGDRELCLAAGMDDYITKPTRIGDLQAVLQRAAELAHPVEAG